MSRNKKTTQHTHLPAFAELPPGALRVLQLSDTHLYATHHGQLMGVNTWDSFQQVLARAREQLGPIDLVLATGDLVHDASPEGYGALKELMSEIGVPVYCLPGNHDSAEIMTAHLVGGRISMPFATLHGEWLLVMLDSTLEGKVEGELSRQDLQRLEAALEAHRDKHILISLHHHPMPVGSNWLDAMGLGNANELFAVLDGYSGVRGIVCGHIHQHFEQQHKGIRVLGSPSTCFQFAPKSARFDLDHEPPGCRWLALLPDGEITTGTLYLDGVPPSLTYSSEGY